MPDYIYKCETEECDLELFKFNRPMSEYQEPKDCPKCGAECKRAQNDFCKNFRLKGNGWYNTGYNGNSNGVPHYKEELRKAGKDPNKHPSGKS